MSAILPVRSKSLAESHVAEPSVAMALVAGRASSRLRLSTSRARRILTVRGARRNARRRRADWHDRKHDHDYHHHPHGSELSETQLRVRALETILTEKGYVDPAALDAIVEAYETRIGPHNGARVGRQGLERSGVQGARCSTTPPRRSARSATRAASAIIWSRSRTRRSATT